MTSPLVSAEWLISHLDAPDVKIVDATWMPPFLNPEKSGSEIYKDAHIPGAVFMDIDAVADQSSSLPHMLPDSVEFINHMHRLGLGDGYKIVIYDQNGYMAAARAWWIMRYMGHKDVSVLDGGITAWKKAGGNIEDLPPQQPKRRQFTIEKRGYLLNNLSEMRQIVSTQSRQIVDARPAPRFTGDAPEPRIGLASGHMPGAVNIPHGQLIATDGTMKKADEILDIFKTCGVDLNAPITTTCGSGVTAAILALGLSIIGRNDVAVYDGSWSEWGSETDCPAVSGA